MRIPRIFIRTPLRAGMELTLPREARQHIERVLRLKPGAEIILFDGRGGHYQAELSAPGTADVLRFCDVNVESPLPIRLVQGLSKGERMDITLQKATELGVQRISPVLTERSVVRLNGERAEKRVLRWQGILQSACEQCGRNTVPELDEVKKLEEYLAEPAKAGVTRIVLSPQGSCRLSMLKRPAALEVLIGPEGGLSEAETRRAIASGHVPVRLGPRILRTETAGLSLIAAAQTLWGDF